MKNNTLTVQGQNISLKEYENGDYISLTDIARRKNPHEPKDVVKNWLRLKNTVAYLGIWEKLNNPDFKGAEFDSFEKEAGTNAFTLSPKRWIETTHAIGLTSKSGNNGGTYAHKDIAFKFASWISVEFELYIIQEFQRLKAEQQEKLSLGWDVKRELAKVNYKIHTDAIKEYLLPTLSEFKKNFAYTDEADFLNVLIFGKTAKQWKEENSELVGNMRDYAGALELVILANIESFNAEYIEQGLNQEDRYIKLREIILRQRISLESRNFKKLEI